MNKLELIKSYESAIKSVKEGLGILQNSRDSLIEELTNTGESAHTAGMHYYDLLEKQVHHFSELTSALMKLKNEVST